ncbi:MAG: twin-arginine translocase subunit TatB [Cycloclasticus sp.]|nr:MAG: twin-arginine translocase subunit TatB [Cycloclasticus sp.]
MFDIGFFEICLIGIISLLVIGPEKLPKVARTAGLWIGKARGMVRTVKYEIDEQIRMDELKQSLEKVENSMNNSVSESMETVESSFNDLKNDIHETTEELSAEEPKPAPTTKPEE